MNIDMPTMKVAMHRFEYENGSLYDLLKDLTKRERRNLLRYGKLSKRVLENHDKTNVEELLNISFEFNEILVKSIKPNYCRK